MKRNPKIFVFNLFLLLTLILSLLTYFQLNEIAKSSGLLQSSPILQVGISGFFILNLLCSLLALTLFLPSSGKVFTVIEKLFSFFRRVKYFNLVWILASLSVLFMLTLSRINFGFSIQRLVPLTVWICIITILFNIFIFIPGLFSKLAGFMDKRKILDLLILGIVSLVFILLLVTATGRYFQTFESRIWTLAILTLIWAEIVRLAYPNVDNRQAFEISLVACVVIFIVCTYCYSSITPYPFSLNWSEGKWFLDGALIFSQKVFGMHSAPPFEEPTRAIMQSFPYLFTNSPSILTLRIWQTLLFLGIPLGCSIALIHRFKTIRGFQKFLLIGWLFSFFFIGPIKFYLLLPLMFFFLGFDSHRFFRSLICIILTAALISPLRWNWFPLPGALALLIYVIENRFENKLITYFWKPAIWMLVSVGICFLSYLFFVKYFGNPAMILEFLSRTTFTWDRLLPSATNPLGLLPSIIICSSPLIVIILLFFRKKPAKIHWIQKATISILVMLFFLGGIIVSSKIGGGNNLHNFDGYLILLGTCVLYFIFNYKQSVRGMEGIGTGTLQKIILAGLCLQVGWVFLTLPVIRGLKTLSSANAEINHIQAMVNEVKEKDPRPILFINQTQLLATKTIQGVSPVANIDNVALLDFALSNSPSLLSEYYLGISQQTWSMILMPPIFENNIKGEEFSFAEENNIWITSIAKPLLCSYHSVEQSLDFDYEIFLPTENAQSCIPMQ